MSSVKAVTDYYDYSQWLYRLFYYNRESLGMHFGFWDEATETNDQAVLNVNQALIEAVKITKKDRVLDAGCGVGGTAIYVAQKTGAHVTGITLSKRQVNLAQKHALQRSVEQLTTFKQMDYTATDFADRSFDVIYGLESICYADPPTRFTKEAYRLLKPGGRLVIADGYMSRLTKNASEAAIIRNFKEGFALSHFGTPATMTQALKQAGFKQVTVVDKTQAVQPTIEHLEGIRRRNWVLIQLAKVLPSPYFKAGLANAQSIEATTRANEVSLVAYAIHTAIR